MSEDVNFIGRERRKNLLIVEGQHEKKKLFGLLLKLYPEIDIKMDEIIVYGTNIYRLYQEIVDEYGDAWYKDDVDLPYIVGRKKGCISPLHKNDFMNIILVFDYERHDPSFSKEKINQLQQYFCDMADTGRLFINYPMVESYQHFDVLPDASYKDKKVLVSAQLGSEYKSEVRGKWVARLVAFPDKLKGVLSDKYGIFSNEELVERLLQIDTVDGDIKEQLQEILAAHLDAKNLLTAKHHIEKMIKFIGYAYNGNSYYQQMRAVMNEIVKHNICKANKITSGRYNMSFFEMKQYFELFHDNNILTFQNQCSDDPDEGVIWILNTSVLFIPEYNFSLLEEF